MKRRPLGRGGLEVAPLAFGGNVLGWTLEPSEAGRILDAFVADGFNLIDTADVYSRWAPGHVGGESETVLGRWLAARKKRDDVVIATKVGMDMGPGKTGLSARRIREAVEESLRRLRTDRIDLYQSHCDDPNTPQEETLAAYAELIREGKVRAIGASNFSAERLAEARSLHHGKGLPAYKSLQPEYNLYDRQDYESKLEGECVREGLGVITYFSLASGFLTGKYRSEADLEGRARGSRVRRYLTPRGRRILAALDRVAAARQAKPAQVALAWIIARPSVTAPIASATSLGQLRELMDGARLELAAAEISDLNEASAPDGV